MPVLSAKRKIVRIDEEKCNGCGLCIPNCAEGALKIIDGKAKLVSDVYCDGLGACLGHCPQDAITVIERAAEDFDEEAVKERLKALSHEEEKIMQEGSKMHNHDRGGCPGSQAHDFRDKDTKGDESGKRESQLRQWPIQLHLVSPMAPYYQKADVLLSADCVAYTVGDFHKDYLKGKSLCIACPKLDEGQEVYAEKIQSLIDDAKINTLTVMTMQVPCCAGLVATAQSGASNAKRKIPIKSIVLSLQGDVLSEEWVS